MKHDLLRGILMGSPIYYLWEQVGITPDDPQSYFLNFDPLEKDNP